MSASPIHFSEYVDSIHFWNSSSFSSFDVIIFLFTHRTFLFATANRFRNVFGCILLQNVVQVTQDNVRGVPDIHRLALSDTPYHPVPRCLSRNMTCLSDCIPADFSIAKNSLIFFSAFFDWDLCLLMLVYSETGLLAIPRKLFSGKVVAISVISLVIFNDTILTSILECKLPRQKSERTRESKERDRKPLALM